MRKNEPRLDPLAVRPKAGMIDRERLWERQPFDDDLQWAAFRAFVQLPMPRHVNDLARAVGLPVDQCVPLAKKGRFFARAALWDAELARLYNTSAARTAVELGEANARMASETVSVMLELSLSEARKHLLTSQTSTHDTMGVEQLTRLLAGAVKAHESLTKVADVAQHQHVHMHAAPAELPDVSALSLDEADKLKATLLKLKKGS